VSAPSELRLERVGKAFGRHRALIDVSVTFAPAQVAAVLGPNGAGKSTLLGILSTLVRPSSGVVRFGDTVIARNSPVRTTIGYVGHEPGLYGDLTARQNLELFAALYGRPHRPADIDVLLERVGLADVRREAIVRTFSRGMQQRLALARALLPEPQVLLFDEPSAALDPAGAAWLAEEIGRERDAGRMVVLVTHDLDAAASVATQLVILRRGRVACDDTRPGGFTAAAVRALYEERTRAS
jgi:heme exporter protein A